MTYPIGHRGISAVNDMVEKALKTSKKSIAKKESLLNTTACWSNIFYCYKVAGIYIFQKDCRTMMDETLVARWRENFSRIALEVQGLKNNIGCLWSVVFVTRRRQNKSIMDTAAVQAYIRSIPRNSIKIWTILKSHRIDKNTHVCSIPSPMHLRYWCSIMHSFFRWYIRWFFFVVSQRAHMYKKKSFYKIISVTLRGME